MLLVGAPLVADRVSWRGIWRSSVHFATKLLQLQAYHTTAQEAYKIRYYRQFEEFEESVYNGLLEAAQCATVLQRGLYWAGTSQNGAGAQRHSAVSD